MDDDQTEGDTASLGWAKIFWRENWRLYSCDMSLSEMERAARTIGTREAVNDAQGDWRRRLDELFERFSDKAWNVGPDLYSPDKHEVLSGIAHRALKELHVLISLPALWSMKHGAPYIRNIVESRITLRWLIQRNESSMYTRYKAYGRGHLKLLKPHLENYRDSLTGEQPELDQNIEYLNAMVNRDTWEEFQEISLEGNFAGTKDNTRTMADQAGLINEYRIIFAPASANIHGEWAALDEHALTVCKNPLHRGHRIIKDDAQILLGPDFIETAFEQVGALVDDYFQAWP